MGSSVNTILQSYNKTRVARAQYRSAKQQTVNTNKLESSKATLADYMREAANKARVRAASKEYNWQIEKLSDELRASQGAGFKTQVQLASARGALAAQSGYVGVGGTSVELMDTMVRLQAEMDQEAAANARNMLASRGAQQTAQIMVGAYNGMDLSRTFGSFDYTQYIEPKAMKRRLGKLIGVAVATYFGGPEAGEAVADMAVAEWQASNGDFDGSGRSWSSAFSNAGSAMQGWNQRGGQAWGSAVAEGWGWTGAKASNSNGAKVSTQLGNNYDNFTTSTGGLGWF